MSKILQYYKNLPKNEFRQFRKEVSLPEYIIWWIIRGLMIYALCRQMSNPDVLIINCLAIAGNLLATFTVILGRIIFPKFFFLGRLPYILQRYITLPVFLGCFFGQYMHFYSRYSSYDKWLHLIAGFIGVFIGYHVMMAMKHNKRLVPPFIASFVSFGFSCFISVAWEIFEFIFDFYFASSYNQNYRWNPDPDNLFFKIFGEGAGNAGQVALYDTMFDVIIGVIGAIIGGIVIWPYVKHEMKKISDSTRGDDRLIWEEIQDKKAQSLTK
ncbi:MAG: hypothetical protein BWY46_00445 [Firmicutes bacterium ADurb.Bin300]|jgi:uncharacterized membrane protein YeaQ/YmgE (transglycosylase-associated protein family)|nr:MAG: hypothetical protein BWY46_00445 [Firmicutes bacterium ADurb.Bin300]